jgi:hypothetical protein
VQDFTTAGALKTIGAAVWASPQNAMPPRGNQRQRQQPMAWRPPQPLMYTRLLYRGYRRRYQFTAVDIVI